MNEIITSLLTRKSVRSYTDQEISPQCKEQILYAAMEAPTAGNQQMYTILDITRQNLKEKLAVTCDNQPFIAKGKMVLIFCADFQKWYQAFKIAGCDPRKPGPGDFLLAVEDAAIAAQNAVTAAQSLGIGSCYIGDIMEKIRENIADLKGEDFDSWMKRFCKRKYQADFSLEMSRSVAAALKNFQE